MDDFKNLLRSLAPGLATAVAGPLGGVVATMLAGKLGIEEKTVDTVAKALTSGSITPEQSRKSSWLRLSSRSFSRRMK